jgi:drug/metabolite transporter (DMT)-like permease
MHLKLALIAAFLVTLCDGTAVVLEKITADKHARVNRLKFGFLVRLLNDWPYIVGLILEFFGWILTLFAVHYLPLFVAQPIFACAVVVSVFAEFFILHRTIKRPVAMAIGLIIVGLLVISITASSQKAYVINPTFKIAILLVPLALAVISAVVVKFNSKLANFGLGALSGIAFGGTSITGRMLRFYHPFWHLLISPTFWSLLGYGIIGLLTFTLALQRHRASIVFAANITLNNIFPILIGIFFLGDAPRNNNWLAVGLGIALVLAGAIVITQKSPIDDLEEKPLSQQKQTLPLN